MAEINRVKLPIQASDLQSPAATKEDQAAAGHVRNRRNKKKARCTIPSVTKLPPELVAPPVPTYFTLEFSRSRLRQYLVQDANTFFTQAQRIRQVWDIIERSMVTEDDLVARSAPELLKDVLITTYSMDSSLIGHSYGQSVGIDFLIQSKVYVAAYPLHDGDTKPPPDYHPPKTSRKLSTWPLRPWLYETWARPGRFLKDQPLDQIRQYFGEKVGIYFAWLGFYTKMLVPLTILGLIVFLYGIYAFETPRLSAAIARDQPMLDVCQSDLGNMPICRPCSYGICKFTRLKNSCTAAKANAVFNNYATMVFAFLSSIWAIVFLELWKREQSRLTCKWDTFDVEMDYEPPRPEYQVIPIEKGPTHEICSAAATDMRRNPITQESEPYILSRNLLRNTILSFGTVIFMICIVLSVISAVILYKVGMVIVFYNWHHPLVAKIGSATVASVTASLINAVCIMILEKAYGNIAWKMTEIEYPRTDGDFEASYTYKMFIFQFVNYYATLFYLSFIQGNLSSDPTHDTMFTDRCPPTGCMFSVTTQLFIVLTVKQVVNNIGEIGAPMMKNWLKRRKNAKATEDNEYTRWEKDFDLEQLPKMSLFGEYFEMVMQFGFVTLFVAAFPLAPLFALLNNIVEKRLDAYKFIGEARRVLPHRAANIGSWYGILEVIAKVAVLTNALLIAFTTDLLDRIIYTLVYSYVNWSLAYFDTDDWYDNSLKDYNGTTIEYCRYRGYYSMPRSMIEKEIGLTEWQENRTFVQETVIGAAYHRTEVWWRVMVAKLFFVIIFEHTIFGIQSVIQYLIPDIPEEVNLHVQRNRHVAKLGAKILSESKQKEKEEKEVAGKKKHPPAPEKNPESLSTALPQNPIESLDNGSQQPSEKSSSSLTSALQKAKGKKFNFPGKKKKNQSTPSETASDLEKMI